MQEILFLGGAPKCGTSAFYDMLTKTGVFDASTLKETFYYIDNTYPLYNNKSGFYKSGHEGFSGFFTNNGKTRLEATTHLIYQQKMPEVLAPLNCKVIFVLRDPADRIRSSFEYTLNNLGNFKEPISFAEYVDLLLQNQKDQLMQKMRATTSQWVLSNEILLSSYQQHIERWCNALGAERVMVLSFDELKANPNESLEKALRFAKIETSSDTSQISLEKKNQTVAIRSRGLHKALAGLNNLVPNGTIKSKIKSAYFGLQKGKRNWTEADEKALERLKEYFKNNQPGLAEIINQHNK